MPAVVMMCYPTERYGFPLQKKQDANKVKGLTLELPPESVYTLAEGRQDIRHESIVNFMIKA